MKKALLALLLVGCLVQPSWAGFAEGLAAYKKGDYDTALREWRPLADKGMPAAQGNLGFMYATGRGVPQNYAEAQGWYLKAADQGDAKAQLNLGTMYANGQGVAVDHPEAVKWYRKAADQGEAKAQFNLAVMYARGQGLPQSHQEALKWCKRSAEQGEPKAQFNLGMMYLKGQGTPQDLIQAHFWFNIASSSQVAEVAKNAAGHRDRVAAQMTPFQRAAAKVLAEKWKPKPERP